MLKIKQLNKIGVVNEILTEISVNIVVSSLYHWI